MKLDDIAWGAICFSFCCLILAVAYAVVKHA